MLVLLPVLRKQQRIASAFVLVLLVFLVAGPVVVSSESTIRRSEKATTTKTTSHDSSSSSSSSSSTIQDSCLDQPDHPDRMTSFPGYNQPLPSAWYSGYLDYELEGQTVHTHYVLVQAEEQQDDGDDDNDDDLPLIYWTNGGPGASSLFGLLTEIGPLMLSDDSLKTDSYTYSGIPTPIYNPYSWTRLGTILVIDQPAPVGFSYCNDDDVKNATSHSCGGIAWTDELSSLNAYTALQTFFGKKFPCLASKDLYVTGESYGGIYVPTLARRIVEGNTHDSNSNINLKGFAVGDGCLGTDTSMCGGLGSAQFVDYWHLWFMAGHHQMPLADFRSVMKACSHSHLPGFLATGSKDDDLCREALSRTKKEIGGFFEYALYDECTYRNGLKWKSRLGVQTVADPRRVHGALNDYPCGAGPVLEEYLALGTVISDAFHVRSTFFEVDNAEGDFDYTPTEPDLEPFYQEMNGKLRILVYNGDTDPAITSFATQNWTSHLGFDQLSRARDGNDGRWRPWTTDGCQNMGGYVERYEGNFDFLTIRGAGHMVPTYKPEASFAFLGAWLRDEDYPRFDANCTSPPLLEAASPSFRTTTTTNNNNNNKDDTAIDGVTVLEAR
jgi:carboxypeptidase C (cathepsin A)